MSKEIIELAQNCSLVKVGSKENGHDCWGNSEWSEYMYVIINGKREEIWDGWYVIHDGTEVIDICTEFLLELRKREQERKLEQEKHLKETGFRTPAEYSAYLKGKNESNNNK